MGIVERIKKVIEYEQISTRKFCIEIGVANGFFDKVKDVGSEKVLKILNRYPEISPEWLLMGTGGMLRQGNADDAADKPLMRPARSEDGLIDKIAQLAEQVGKLRAENEHLKNENGRLRDEVNKYCHALGEVREVPLLEG
jgi:cell division protein FtsB